MKQKIRLAVFDLDGTLADTIPDLAGAMAHILKKYGDFGDVEPLVRRSVGRGVYVLFEKVYGELGIDSQSRLADVEAYKAYYAAHCFQKTRLYPHTVAVLEELKRRGIHLAVATMKPREATHEVLRQTGLLPYMEAVYAQEDMERPKPEPWCVVHLAEKFGVPLSETAMIGDSLNDVGAGKAAGAVSVAVLGGYADPGEMRRSGADYVIDDIGYVRDIFEGGDTYGD